MFARKMTRRQFFERSSTFKGSDGFSLGAADAYQFYSYVWDVLKFREKGIQNFWKGMPPQSPLEMADDWVEANPHMVGVRNSFWDPQMLRSLGFVLDASGHVKIPDK